MTSPFAEGPGPALIYFAFRAGAFLAETTPRRMAERAARMAGRLAYRLARGKRRIVRTNLARVVGEGPHLDGVVRRAFESYARYWLETFRMGRYSKDEIRRLVDCPSVGVLERALGRGDGVVIVTGHFGFYDFAVAWIGVNGFPLGTVAEVLRPRALFEWFASIREERGMKVIPSKPREETIARQHELLSRGEGVALLADRNLSRRGVWAELLGERTTLPSGPALLVSQTKAALLSGAIYQVGEGYRLDFEEIPLTDDERGDVERVAQKIAGAIETMVRKAPEQWHLFSTNWPSDEPHLPPRGVSRRAKEVP